jgi:uncharacterized protein (DUF433 family)
MIWLLTSQVSSRLSRDRGASLAGQDSQSSTCVRRTKCADVDRDPGKRGGQWCIKGTSVPVERVIDHARDGFSAEQIGEMFPESIPPDTVRRIARRFFTAALTVDLQPGFAELDNARQHVIDFLNWASLELAETADADAEQFRAEINRAAERLIDISLACRASLREAKP